MERTIGAIYQELISAFTECGIAGPKVDAFRLLNHFAGVTRNDLIVHGEKMLTPEQTAKLEEAKRRRCKREPLQYITGTECFMGLDFKVNENVLIPRADTEVLVETARRELHDGFRILDLCTGSGCILISLLKYSNGCEGVGVDLSEAALEIARENGERILFSELDEEDEYALSMQMICDHRGSDCKVEWLQGDLYAPVEGKFDMILSNPPYIATQAIEELEPEVRDYEPRMALDGTEDGLLFYRRILEEAPKYLHAGGQLFFEIGYDQGEAVQKLMEESGFHYVEVRKDYAGLDRVVYGTLKF